jgi:glutamate carboxypeptidase
LGANAILQIAQTIQKIAALTDYQQQITFNVGRVSGGVVVNRVPHYAEAEVEMRAFSSEVYEQGIANMLALNGSSDVASHNNGYHCRVSVEVVERTAPWPTNPATQALYRVWERASNRLGMRIAVEERGGLSDANLLWSHFPTIDGLGPAGANAHCSERNADGSKDQEYAIVSSFIPKTMLNLTSIIDLLDGSVK